MASNRKQEVEEAQKSLDLTKKTYIAELDTTQGPIRLTFLPDVAPGHVKNFLGLAKLGFYDGLIFHRVIKGFMIQGGCPEGSGMGGPGYKIPAEFNKTPHEPGVLSMARSSDPNSGGSQFFICLGRHSHLDQQYTAFGRVADEESMETVKAIGSLPVGQNDRPKQEAKIRKVTIHEEDK